MKLMEAILLGVIQGATEFLPISSSGHLVLLPEILGITRPDLSMAGLVHAGTLLAVLIYFRRDIWAILTAVWRGLADRQPWAEAESRLGWLILLGTVPVGIAGLTLNDFFERVFGAPAIVAGFLLVTAVLLVIGERQLTGEKLLANMTWADALIVGGFQLLALFPGLSRSGSTIIGGLLRGFDRPTATRFSFLIGIPAIAAAGLLSILEIFTVTEAAYGLLIYLAAFFAAAISGYLCIHLLLTWVKNHGLYIFAAYCALFGTLFLIFS
jgi:undecaprenyl-diphosphatase